MASEVSVIQSLKAVDAWIDVINANINGGVRTAFKSSRLKFAGSNVDVSRAGTTTSLPLQFPEPGLQTANTVIDFSQGAITASTENTHLAIQGEGFFLVASPDMINTANGRTIPSASAKLYLTRDGEFRTNAQGLLVNSSGYFLVTVGTVVVGGKTILQYSTGLTGTNSAIRAVYNDVDLGTATTPAGAVKLSDFLAQTVTTDLGASTDIATDGGCSSLINVTLGKQSLQYTQFGSTVFDVGFAYVAAGVVNVSNNVGIARGSTATATVLSKSLEASNASMTQSVPELSLAQKLFSALTKVLQTKQTNVDGVLNLIR
jgi:flagellar hook protein FlgE